MQITVSKIGVSVQIQFHKKKLPTHRLLLVPNLLLISSHIHFVITKYYLRVNHVVNRVGQWRLEHVSFLEFLHHSHFTIPTVQHSFKPSTPHTPEGTVFDTNRHICHRGKKDEQMK